MPYQFIKDQVGIQNTPPVDMAIFYSKTVVGIKGFGGKFNMSRIRVP